MGPSASDVLIVFPAHLTLCNWSFLTLLYFDRLLAMIERSCSFADELVRDLLCFTSKC